MNIPLKRFVGRLWHWLWGHDFKGGINDQGDFCEPKCSCGADFKEANAVWEGAWREAMSFARQQIGRFTAPF